MTPVGTSSRLDALVFGRGYRAVARGLTAFGALALPSACVVCGTWDTSLCPRCAGSFRAATARPFRAEDAAESLPDVPLRSPTAGNRGSGHRVSGVPAQVELQHYGPLPVLAAGRYGHDVSAVMLAFKNHGHVDIAAPVTAALAGALHEAVTGEGLGPVPGGPVLLVPVPTRAAARRRRGYDPLMLLLTRLDRSKRLPAGLLLAPRLRHVPLPRRVASELGKAGFRAAMHVAQEAMTQQLTGGQKGAGRRRRRSNVLYSMNLSERSRLCFAGRPCLIVDDVLTTGATIGEAHRALSEAGASVLGAVVIAATGSPSGDGSTRKVGSVSGTGGSAGRPVRATRDHPAGASDGTGGTGGNFGASGDE